MNRYAEIRMANQDLAEVFKETLSSLHDLRELFLENFDCGKITTVALDYTSFTLMNDMLREKGLRYIISYVHETNKIELYLSGRTHRINEQVKALLGLEGGVDWIYMFVLSEDYEPDEEDENEDIFYKAMSYMEFIETEIEDIV